MNEIVFNINVIHGTEDPVLSYEHGRLLASTIPGCKLLTLEGSGHEFNFHEWDLIINTITEHTNKQ